MTENNALTPVAKVALTALSESISEFIASVRSIGYVQQTRVKKMRDKADAALAIAKRENISAIIEGNIDSICRVQERIDYYVKQDKLHDRSLELAYNQLDLLNDSLRKNLSDFENRWDFFTI